MPTTPTPPAPKLLIAEDETLLREQLREGLNELWPAAHICAEAADGAQALKALLEHEPDVAFLDIQMPHLSGLEIAHHAAGRCHLVFVTAYDRFAIDAFEHGAVDYLLKPLKQERLAQAVARLKTRLGSAPAAIAPLLAERPTLSQQHAGPAGHLEWLKAAQGNTVRLISVNDVLYLQADERYTRVITHEREAFIKTPIRELAEQLDPRRFWQIHRSTLVNVHVIETATRNLTGGVELRLKSRSERLQVSRAFAHLFRQM
jgi:DNA-binding LytR/AlgR family response regulator